jgi:hypothetical protein
MNWRRRIRRWLGLNSPSAVLLEATSAGLHLAAEHLSERGVADRAEAGYVLAVAFHLPPWKLVPGLEGPSTVPGFRLAGLRYIQLAPPARRATLTALHAAAEKTGHCDREGGGCCYCAEGACDAEDGPRSRELPDGALEIHYPDGGILHIPAAVRAPARPFHTLHLGSINPFPARGYPW